MSEKDVIFISWSGKDTASFRMAEILYEVLPAVFQSAECFLSDDIDKGKIGINEILVNLSKAKIGIICVTKANIEKTWLNFETGALASAVFNKNGNAITLLIDMTTDEYAAANSPIRNLQATILEESDLLKMFMSINKSLDNALSDSQLKLLFDSVAKNKILECDTSTPTVSKSQEKQPFVSDILTKDAKKLLKALYNDYADKRSHDLSRAEASEFNNIDEICRLSNMSVDDIRELFEVLSNLGYLKYDGDDNFYMVFGKLTDKGIKYGEENFYEPTYIILLREIIKQYNSRKAYVPSDRFENFSSDDFSVLKSKGFIDMTKYLNGNFVVKPTDSGIAEIVMRDE